MLNQIKQIRLNLALTTSVGFGLISIIQLYNYGRFLRCETDIKINKQDMNFQFKETDRNVNDINRKWSGLLKK